MPFLALYIDKNLFDRIPVEDEMLTTPGYLSSLSRELKSIYSVEIDGSVSGPEFLIEEYSFPDPDVLLSRIHKRGAESRRNSEEFLP